MKAPIWVLCAVVTVLVAGCVTPATSGDNSRCPKNPEDCERIIDQLIILVGAHGSVDTGVADAGGSGFVNVTASPRGGISAATDLTATVTVTQVGGMHVVGNASRTILLPAGTSSATEVIAFDVAKDAPATLDVPINVASGNGSATITPQFVVSHASTLGPFGSAWTWGALVVALAVGALVGVAFQKSRVKK